MTVAQLKTKTTSIRKVQDEHDINLGDLERTLADRTTYNEWVVRDYVVRGIFAVEPFEVSVLEVFDLPPEVPEEFRLETPDLNIRRSSLKDVESAFPDQDVYTFKSGKILKVTADQCVPVEHDDIYRH